MPGHGSSGSRRWRRDTVSLLLLATLGLAGCSGVEDAPAAPPATIHPAWPGCDPLGAFQDPFASANPFETGGVPAGFVPVAVTLCEVRDAATPGGTGDAAVSDVERRATAIAPLLTYLARPSRQSTNPDKLACQAMGWQPPWLFLVDADERWIAPRLPTDACGFPLGLFAEQSQQLPYDTLPYTDRVIRTRSR